MIRKNNIIEWIILSYININTKYLKAPQKEGNLSVKN